MGERFKLEIQGVSKSFPGVKALDNVNIALRPGTVHAVMGENGAGKSTLMKIINGLYKRDEGKILLDGKEVHFSGPEESGAAGIAMIYQELNFFPELTVAENMFMKRQPGKGGFVSWGQMMEDAQKILDENGLSYDPSEKIKNLPIASVQMLEIIKAVAFKAQVIIMDEPTSSISNKEVEFLFETIRRLKEQGISFLYISHKMEEIFRIADDITIIRDGKSIISGRVDEFTEDSIITHMVGRSIDNIYPKEQVPIGEVVFEAKNLTTDGMFRNVSLEVRKGEIVGMAGLVGAGRSEVCRAVFGLDPLDSGEITLCGEKYVPKDVTHAIKNKILMITEDRKKEGIIGVRSCRENITLTNHHIQKGVFMNLKQEIEDAKRMAEMLKVRFAGIETPIGSLSGGNQQKVLLSMWLSAAPDVVLIDEPTRGVDVGAKAEIHLLLRDVVKEGKGVVMVSSELPEIMASCDRVLVMYEGRCMGCLENKDLTEEKLMAMASGYSA